MKKLFFGLAIIVAGLFLNSCSSEDQKNQLQAELSQVKIEYSEAEADLALKEQQLSEAQKEIADLRSNLESFKSEVYDLMPFEGLDLIASIADQVDFFTNMKYYLVGNSPISLWNTGYYNDNPLSKWLRARWESKDFSVFEELYFKNKKFILPFLNGATRDKIAITHDYLSGNISQKELDFFTALRDRFPTHGATSITGYIDHAPEQDQAKLLFGWNEDQFYLHFSHWWWSERRKSDGSSPIILKITQDIIKSI